MTMDAETPEDLRGETVKRWLLRTSWVVMATGGAISVLAASIGGVEMSRTGTYSDFVGTLRATGGAVMGVGLVFVLLAMRAPAIVKAWRRGTGRDRAPRRATTFASDGAFAVVLGIVASLTLALWVLPFLLPGVLNFLATYIFLLFLPVVLITACVYGRGTLRTFCIGALLPTGIATIGMALFTNVLFQSMFHRYGASFRDLAEFGQGNLTAAIVWTSCLIFGAVSIATRFIVEAVSPVQAELAELVEPDDEPTDLGR